MAAGLRWGPTAGLETCHGWRVPTATTSSALDPHAQAVRRAPAAHPHVAGLSGSARALKCCSGDPAPHTLGTGCRDRSLQPKGKAGCHLSLPTRLQQEGGQAGLLQATEPIARVSPAWALSLGAQALPVASKAPDATMHGVDPIRGWLGIRAWHYTDNSEAWVHPQRYGPPNTEPEDGTRRKRNPPPLASLCGSLGRCGQCAASGAVQQPPSAWA